MNRVRCRLLTPVSNSVAKWTDDAIVAWDERGVLVGAGPWDGSDAPDLRPAVITPGFVDAHVHFPQTRIIGAATGPLLPWLASSVFPEEALFADPAHAERVADVFCGCLAGSGTTTALVYGSVHREATERLFEALDRWGLRATAGPVWMDEDCPEELSTPYAVSEETVRGLAARWQGHDGRLSVAVLPRFALSCSRESLGCAGRLAVELGLRVSTHLAENTDECRLAAERFGTADYLQVYEDAGLVHERSVFAHCVHLDDDAWDRMAASRAVVAHCPDSNAFLGSGHMPLDRVLDRGIAMAVGSDVAAGRGFSMPRHLAAAFDNGLAVRRRLLPEALFWTGTRGGAQALGHANVGAVEPGFYADLCAWDLPEWVETGSSALSWLLLNADAPRPRQVWVNGRTVWERGPGHPYPWSYSGRRG